MAPLQPKGGHFGLILPLCTSSATVGLALYQYPVFGSFMMAESSIAGKPFSRYWTAFLGPSVGLIIVPVVASTISGVLCGRWLGTHQTLETSDVSKWYTYGAVLAGVHLLLMPFAAAPIKRIADASKASVKTEEQVDEENRAEMKTWFMWHTIRTLAVDIPALWCFAEGAALSFWVI